MSDKETSTETKKNSKKTPSERKESKKKYLRDYYRRKYHESPDYREKKKKETRDRYIKKTLRCDICYTKFYIEDLKTLDIDINSFECPSCKDIKMHPKQDRSKLGVQKICTNNIDV